MAAGVFPDKITQKVTVKAVDAPDVLCVKPGENNKGPDGEGRKGLSVCEVGCHLGPVRARMSLLTIWKSSQSGGSLVEKESSRQY